MVMNLKLEKGNYDGFIKLLIVSQLYIQRLWNFLYRHWIVCFLVNKLNNLLYFVNYILVNVQGEFIEGFASFSKVKS